MSNQKSPKKTLDNLVELLCDEAMAASDADIVAEATAYHGDAKTHVSKLRAMAEERIAMHRKKRLFEARQKLDAASSAEGSNALVNRTLSEMKDLVLNLLKKRDDLPQRLTMAARSGESMSDEDWASLYDDLSDLGFFDGGEK